MVPSIESSQLTLFLRSSEDPPNHDSAQLDSEAKLGVRLSSLVVPFGNRLIHFASLSSPEMLLWKANFFQQPSGSFSLED